MFRVSKLISCRIWDHDLESVNFPTSSCCIRKSSVWLDFFVVVDVVPPSSSFFIFGLLFRSVGGGRRHRGWSNELCQLVSAAHHHHRIVVPFLIARAAVHRRARGSSRSRDYGTEWNARRSHHHFEFGASQRYCALSRHSNSNLSLSLPLHHFFFFPLQPEWKERIISIYRGIPQRNYMNTNI